MLYVRVCVCVCVCTTRVLRADACVYDFVYDSRSPTRETAPISPSRRDEDIYFRAPNLALTIASAVMQVR